MTKLYIIREIRRTTQANGCTPLRKTEFEAETGIKRYDWFGVYWARWSDALREAGCEQHHNHTARKHQHSKSLSYASAQTVRHVRLA